MFHGAALHAIPEMLPVGEIAAGGADRFGDRIAIVAPELSACWTYRELAERVDRALALLQARGLRPGDRFAYLGRNSDNFVILQFAAVRGGMILVALNWRSVIDELAYFLADSTPRIVFADPEFQAALAQAWPGRATDDIVPTEQTAAVPGLRALLDAPAGPAVPAAADTAAICLILYTSGTTGKPKGAMISQAMLTACRQVEFCADGFPPEPDDRMLVAVPLFHLGGITMALIALVRGATCVLTNNPAAENLLHVMRTQQVTLTWLVPTMIRSLVDLLEQTGTTLPEFRTMMYGGAPIAPDMLLRTRSLLGCRFSNSYGATEIGSITILPPQDHDPDRPGLLRSVGRPMPGTAIEIRDEAGAPVPVGISGEVWVRTPTLMSGYWQRPTDTAEAVVDGWYRTGDGGYHDAEGYLYLTDRIKDMIVSGGENVYPVEVEDVLRTHPDVLDVAVVGQADERWGEAVVAVVEARPDRSPDSAAVIAFARARLSAYKCPKQVRFVPTLPKTASGKVQRGAVRTMLHAERG